MTADDYLNSPTHGINATREVEIDLLQVIGMLIGSLEAQVSEDQPTVISDYTVNRLVNAFNNATLPPYKRLKYEENLEPVANRRLLLEMLGDMRKKVRAHIFNTH